MKKILNPIALSLLCIILNSCLDSNKRETLQLLDSIDEILVSVNTNGGRSIVKYLSSDEIDNFKRDIEQIKINKYCDSDKKVQSAYYLILQCDNKIAGFLTIDSISNSCIKIHLPTQEQTFIFETSFDFKGYFDEMILKKNIDCNQTFRRSINLEELSLKDYINILKVKNPCPNGVYRLSTRGSVGEDWIKDSDIENLISLIDSKDTAYCIVQMISSNLPDPADYSTLGGQIMDLLDSYRLEKDYPNFLSSCSKNDELRQQRILEWWSAYNK